MGCRNQLGQPDNYKRAYLRELKILACAVVSQVEQKVFDPDRVPLVLTHPEGMTHDCRTSEPATPWGDAASISLVSESRANHHYFEKWVQSLDAANPFVFNLLMDMGGGTTDFSLLHKNELKAYDSLGEIRSNNRIRFVGASPCWPAWPGPPCPTGHGNLGSTTVETLRVRPAPLRTSYGLTAIEPGPASPAAGRPSPARANWQCSWNPTGSHPPPGQSGYPLQTLPSGLRRGLLRGPDRSAPPSALW